MKSDLKDFGKEEKITCPSMTLTAQINTDTHPSAVLSFIVLKSFSKQNERAHMNKCFFLYVNSGPNQGPK